MRKLKWPLVLFVLSIALSAMFSHKAFAACNAGAGTDPSGGQAECGYFFQIGPQTKNFSQILEPANYLPASTDKQTFINAVLSALNSGSTQNQVGAAFIIQRMRGDTSRNENPNNPSSDITDWENRINAPGITLQINNYNYTWNSGYMGAPAGPNGSPPAGAGADDAYYSDPSTASSLQFFSNGTLVFSIKLSCGNLVGNTSPKDDVGLPEPSGGGGGGGTGTIQGRVWRDDDSGGTQNGSEPLVDNGSPCPGSAVGLGATVTVSGIGTQTVNQCLGGGPAYQFTNVPLGQYTVTVTPPSGYSASPAYSSQSVTVTSGTSIDGNQYPHNASANTVQPWFGIVQNAVVQPPPAPPPMLNPGCSGTTPNVMVSWPSDGTNSGYSVNAGEAADGLGWFDNVAANGSGAGATMSKTYTQFPNHFSGINGTLTFMAGQMYQIAMVYNSTGQSSAPVWFTASSCAAIAAPVVTPGCNGSAPNVKVKWQSDGSSNGYGVMADNDNNYGDGSWYENANSGSGTISNTYTQFTNPLNGASGTLTLASGQLYQIRIYYYTSAQYSPTASFRALTTCGSSASPTLSCVNINPTAIEPGVASSFKLSFNNTGGGQLTTSSISISASPVPTSMSNNTNIGFTVGGVSQMTLPAGGTAVSAPVNITAAAGTYTITLTINGGNASPTTYTCPLPLTSAYKPYFKVYGGDVSVGNGFGSSCTAPAIPPGIIGWNQDTGTYSGAGAQFGTQAPGNINGFASAQGSGSPYAGLGLSFANTVNTPPASDDFGGQFGGSSCIHDFYGDKPASLTTSNIPGGNLSTWASNTYYSNGDLTLAGGTLGVGQQITLYVSGNVYINSNIKYTTTGWSLANPASLTLPSFRLIVSGGNIYIGTGVKQLDGLYVAQPTTSTNGAIYTCASGLANPELASNTSYFTDCGNQLQVNGAFVASQVYLMRSNGTNGTLSQSTGDTLGSNNAAEYFNYSPEMWIGSAALNPTQSLQYDSITSLPPVL